jgi:SAM-dependent methyltransferase
MTPERYRRCIRQWDEVFARESDDVPAAPETGNLELNEALSWLCKQSETVLDFGCGNGALLFCCALLGTKRHIGVDLSARAVEKATQRSGKMQGGSFAFFPGGVERLEQIDTGSADAIILSNIIDNLYPDDAEMLAKESRRILKPAGKVLIKLNPHLTERQIRLWNADVIEGDLLDDGLLLLNRTTREWETFLKRFFMIERYAELWYPAYKQTNRLFYLRRQ